MIIRYKCETLEQSDFASVDGFANNEFMARQQQFFPVYIFQTGTTSATAAAAATTTTDATAATTIIFSRCKSLK